MKKNNFSLLLMSLFVYSALATVWHVKPVSSAPVEKKEPTSLRVQKSFAQLPLAFEANRGQVSPEVKYLARGAGYGVFLTADETILQVRGTSEKAPVSTISLQFLNRNSSSSMKSLRELPSVSNYFIGNNPQNWQSEVPNFEKVEYQNLYRGIDLLYYGNQRQLEYDFIVAPKADPNQIKLNFKGAESLRLDKNGDLILSTCASEIRQLKPVAHQDINGQRQIVPVEYILDRQQRISFRLGKYDRTKTLIIDPVILSSTFLGGTGIDTGRAVAVDQNGNIYVYGETTSLDFPGSGSVQATSGGFQDCFILKLNSAGTQILYSTWLGGNSSEQAFGMALDSSGNAYLTGLTNSTNFPVTNGVIQPVKGSSADAFLVKLNASGTALVYSTFVGGDGPDVGLDVAVDANGNAWVVGNTGSLNLSSTGFQANLKGASSYQSIDKGNTWINPGVGIPATTINGFVYYPSNPATVYASSLRGIYTSNNGGVNWAPTGLTNVPTFSLVINPISPSTMYAATATGIQKTTSNGTAWTLKNSGLPGALQMNSIVIDPATPQTLYAGGIFGGIFKSTDGADTWTAINNGITSPQFGQTPPNITRLIINRTNPQILYAGTARGLFKTTDGGANWTRAQSGIPLFASDPSITNLFEDPSAPATISALVNNGGTGLYRTTDGGATWGLVTQGLPIDVAGQTVTYNISTIAVDPANSNNLYAASTSAVGVFKSTDGGKNWSIKNSGLTNLTIGAFGFAPSGSIMIGTNSGLDGFVAKFNSTATALTYMTYLGGTENESISSVAIDKDGNAIVSGNTSSTNFPTMNPLQSASGGVTDAFVAKFNASGTGLLWSTYFGGRGTDTSSHVAINKSGSIVFVGSSSSSNFPTLNGYQLDIRGTQDGYVAKLKSDGSAVEFCTFLGGTLTEQVNGLALDSTDNIYVTGTTTSQDFPQVDPAQNFPYSQFSNSNEIFAAKLNPIGTNLVFSTYLGGQGSDIGNGMAVDALNQVYITGSTSSPDFPSVKPLQSAFAGATDAFLIKLGIEADLSVTQTQTRNPVMINSNQTYSVTVTNNGPSPATGVKLTDVLSAGISFVSATPSQGSCSNASGTITCNLNALTKQQSATIEIVVKPTSGTKITHVVSVSGSDPDSTPTNNQATLETTISILPSIAGRVINSQGNGVSNVNLTLSGGSNLVTTTDNNGYYQISGLALGGSYTIIPSRDNYSFEAPQIALTNVIADQAANFTATPCTFSLAPSLQEFTLAGGSGTITLTGVVRCAWNASVSPDAASWLKITSPTTGSGGSSITYTVAASPTPRSGYIRVAGQNFAVYQRANTVCAIPNFRLRENFIGNAPSSIYTSDVNGDGKPDILVQSENRDFIDGRYVRFLQIAISDGSGNFVSGNRILLDDPGNGLILLVDKDFNRDQKKDLATVDYSSGRVSLYLNDGSGKFTRQIHDINLTPATNVGLFAADMNKDGYLDLLVGGYDASSATYGLKVALGNAQGSFAVPYFVSVNTSSIIAFTDVTGDGIPDIIAPGTIFPTATLLVYPSDGIGSFGAPITSVFAADGVNGTPQYFASGDFNSDGYLDIVLSTNRSVNNTYYASIAIIPGQGNGKFGTAKFTDLTPSTQPRLFVGDFNGDARLDVIGLADQNVNFFAGDGLGALGSPTPFTNNFNPNYGFVVTDLNGDSKSDIAGISFSNGLLNTYLNRCGITISPTIYGRVAFDNPYSVVPGITVKLSGAKTATAITDSFGNYEFTGLTAGANYSVQAEKTTFAFTPATAQIVSLTDEQSATFVATKQATGVSAATYLRSGVAANSIISIFGNEMTSAFEAPKTLPLPTFLGGVQVTFNGGSAELLYVSPSQINLVVPGYVSVGTNTITIYSQSPYQQIITSQIEIVNVAPGLFTATSDGRGPASASVIYVNGVNQRFDLAATCSPTGCSAKPIDLNSADAVFLELYGTGIRNHTGAVTANIGGVAAEVLYVGGHCCFVGLDQVNVKIPKSLVGRGEVDLNLTIDGIVTNTTKINLK